MGGRIRLIGALALGLLLVAAPAIAQGDSSVDRARQWLDQQRKPDGSFDDGVFNPVDLTSNVVMGEVAAGSTPAQATMTWLRDSSAAAAGTCRRRSSTAWSPASSPTAAGPSPRASPPIPTPRRWR